MDPRRSATALPAIAALCVAAGALLLLPIQAASQASGGRTIFRCESAGHVSYTDAPCPDAEKVDAVRLRGVNPPAAPDRMAYAPSDGAGATWRRYSGERAESVEPPAARFASEANPECAHLAQRMARVQAEEQVANAHNIGLIQERLAVQRHWYRQLGCAMHAERTLPPASTRTSNPPPVRDHSG